MKYRLNSITLSRVLLLSISLRPVKAVALLSLHRLHAEVMPYFSGQMDNELSRQEGWEKHNFQMWHFGPESRGSQTDTQQI